MTVAAALRRQAGWCRDAGSELYARLLTAAAADFDAGGPTASLLSGVGDAGRAALALRLMAGVNALVLTGRAPALAAHYPNAGGAPRWPDCADEFLAVVAGFGDELRPWLDLPVQTNEPGRAGVLLGGFLTVARHSGVPLRLLEVGASAGLNLCFDRYRYDLGRGYWGPSASPARLSCEWRGAPPDPATPLEVAARSGCDAAPLDVCAPTDIDRLRAYVWADQTGRLARLDGALAAAAAAPPRVAAADAGAWLAAELRAPAPGTATVVFHSIVWHYLGEEGQARLAAALANAAAGATSDAPVAWLRMEPRLRVATELTLTMWPGGEERVLATCQVHGAWADWA